MARRISGGIDVRWRPDGGAVITLKSVTGEAFEIERTVGQVAELVSALSNNPSPTPKPVAEEEAAPEPAAKARGKGKRKEKDDA